MRLPPFAFTVLDTETTGFVPRVHHVIEFASMRFENGALADSFETLLGIKEEIPPHIRVLTRIRNEDVKGQPTFEEQKAAIAAHIGEGTLIVGQNLGFDIGMLKGEGIDLSDRAWIDTSLLASLVFPELRSYSLGYLSRVLDLNHAPVHRALGDVRATSELLSKIWERLLELPSDLLADAKRVMSHSSPGYHILFDALEDAGRTDRPSWMVVRPRAETTAVETRIELPVPQVGTVCVQEEPLEPSYLQSVINGCTTDTVSRHLIAVKNLEQTLKHLSVPEGVRVLHPPFLLLDTEASERLMAQPTYTVDEALTVLKLKWFAPRTRHDLALHGGEKDVWNGKLACTDASAAYTAQLATDAGTYLLDHRQLLTFLREQSHTASRLLDEKTHVIVDDASMLEDTATKAFGAEASLDDLRASAQGDDALMRCIDLLNLWAEKIRINEDQHFLTEADLDKPETKGLKEQVELQIARTDLTQQTRSHLERLLPLFQKENVRTHVLWIELKQNGSLQFSAFPERIDVMLDEYLYGTFKTTLLAPPGCEKSFPETIPAKRAIAAQSAPETDMNLTLTFPEQGVLRDLLKAPPGGKTIMLLPSKRIIEQLFIDFTEILEKEGVTLICQGMSGGQNRMEAEFIAAKAPAIWLLTPWTYEGTELPENTVDRLVIDMLPFDHPGAPLMQRRKEHWRNSFTEYAVPRVHHRLFRLLRTFCRHSTAAAETIVLDKRLHEKDYGRSIRSYLERFDSGEQPSSTIPVTPKEPPMQPSLF